MQGSTINVRAVGSTLSPLSRGVETPCAEVCVCDGEVAEPATGCRLASCARSSTGDCCDSFCRACRAIAILPAAAGVRDGTVLSGLQRSRLARHSYQLVALAAAAAAAAVMACVSGAKGETECKQYC